MNYIGPEMFKRLDEKLKKMNLSELNELKELAEACPGGGRLNYFRYQYLGKDFQEEKNTFLKKVNQLYPNVKFDENHVLALAAYIADYNYKDEGQMGKFEKVKKMGWDTDWKDPLNQPGYARDLRRLAILAVVVLCVLLLSNPFTGLAFTFAALASLSMKLGMFYALGRAATWIPAKIYTKYAGNDDTDDHVLIPTGLGYTPRADNGARHLSSTKNMLNGGLGALTQPQTNVATRASTPTSTSFRR